MSHGNSKLARLARPHAERAIQRLAAIVDNGYQPGSVRVAAARALLEFGYGRPTNAARRRSATVPSDRVVEVHWEEPPER
ncbi:MAG: hypothetical protein L0210_00815 [Rhodospirillales bacterium]|nr:hypothetical protein [Rhodospirillales bacterium]